MELGRLLKSMRKKSGFNQSELAYELGVTQGTISKAETNRFVPDAVMLLNWADKTCAKEMLIAFMLGVDTTSVLQGFMHILGFVWIGG